MKWLTLRVTGLVTPLMVRLPSMVAGLSASNITLVDLKLATAKADAAVTARNLENERRKNEALTKQKQKLESNLADARAADAAAIGLRDDLRAIQDRSQTDLAACRNASDTIGQLFVAIDEFAGKTAAEADGHALDKKACDDAWPR